MIGYFIRKIIKVILFALSGVLSLIMYLQYQGLISVNVDEVQYFTDTITNSIVNSTANVLSHPGNKFTIILFHLQEVWQSVLLLDLWEVEGSLNLGILNKVIKKISVPENSLIKYGARHTDRLFDPLIKDCMKEKIEILDQFSYFFHRWYSIISILFDFWKGACYYIPTYVNTVHLTK